MLMKSGGALRGEVLSMADQTGADHADGVPAIKKSFKMRYASHLGFLSRDKPLFVETLGTTDPAVHIEYAADQGFAGIEDNLLAARDKTEQDRIGEALARHSLEMGCFVASVNPAKKSWVTYDETSVAEIDSEIRSAIETAKRVNGRYLTVAPAGDPAVPYSFQVATTVRHLRRVAERCERAGVTLCIEQINQFGLPGMLLQHIADAYAVVKATASPAVKLLFDFNHVQIMDGNLVANFERCVDEIAILQIADMPRRRELGLGEVNWPNVLRAVRNAGYQGLIEYEVVPSLPGKAGEQAALDALRRMDAAI
jgi:hydroxypyruvate isomerase